MSARPVLVAPDKFKGTFSAPEVAAAIAAGVRDAGAEAIELPVADGGDGTARALLAARGGRWCAAVADDPLGRPVQAGYARLEGGRSAVVDVAEASGLWRLAPGERDPWRATTRGTGQLIAAAAAAGAEEVIVAAGGSATVDGGAGAVAVLERLARPPRIVVACDVTTPWEEAAAVYGPQKGAGEDDVARLQRRMDELAAAAPRDPRGVPATGAAGGLSGALWAHFGAALVPGAALVLDAVGFDAAAARAAFVITGEGRIDGQTLEGKAVGEVARRAAAAGLACDAVVGRAALSAAQRGALGVRTVLEAGDAERMRAAGRRLTRAALEPAA
jgi:glycerate kinase